MTLDDDRPARPRNRALLREVYDARYGEFVGLATLILGTRTGAEDVVQDAFAGALRRNRPFRSPDDIGGYIARSVVNGARSRIRARVRTERHPRVAAAEAPSAEAAALGSVDREVVRAALAQLPPRQRECAVCHFQLGLSHAEVAAVLDMRPGTVKTHLRRARASLISLLEDQR